MADPNAHADVRDISELIALRIDDAFMALDEPLGKDVEQDYGRADGKWHAQSGTHRKLYAVEYPARTNNDYRETIRSRSTDYGLAVMELDEHRCRSCGATEKEIALPIYGASGGFAGKNIFYLAAPVGGEPKEDLE